MEPSLIGLLHIQFPEKYFQKKISKIKTTMMVPLIAMVEL
jgi:hypothetical protein